MNITIKTPLAKCFLIILFIIWNNFVGRSEVVGVTQILSTSCIETNE